MVDGHVVVVEDHKEVVGEGGGIVQPLKGHSSRHGTITDKGYDTTMLLLQRNGYSHPERCRDRVRSVPCGECIVLTLGWDREACQPTPLAQRTESFSAPREDLMDIGLMPYVPDDPILWRIEDVVHGYGDFHCSKVCTEVPRIDRERLEHEATDLGTELR